MRLLPDGSLPSTSEVRGGNSCVIGWTCDLTRRYVDIIAHDTT